jgi:hypothetical protein
MKKHVIKPIDRNKLAEGDVYMTVGECEIVQEEIKVARIELLRQDGSLVLSYPVHGKKELEEAKECAQRNNFKIIIKKIL